MRSVIGSNIRRLRRSQDMTVNELAERIGSKREYVTKLENRTPKSPSLEKLQAIANVFEINVAELYEPPKDQIHLVGSDDKDKVFIKKYLRLESSDKQHIQKIIDTYS